MAKTLSKTENKPTKEEIAQRAYLLFEQSGRIPGRDLENWLAAEAELMGSPRNGSVKNGSSHESPGTTRSISRSAAPEANQRRI